MSVISANISFKRGGHELLDFSSKHLNYSTALAWAKDVNSNAAVGQFIYIEQSETSSVLGEEKTFAPGAYIVEAIGEGAVINPLSKSTAGGDADLSGEVSSLQTSVGQVKSDVTAVKQDIESLKAADATFATKEEISAKADASDLELKADKTDLEGLAKSETVNAALDLKADAADVHAYDLVAGKNEGGQYAAQYEFKVDGVVKTTINIAKDQFLKKAEFVASATTEDQEAGAVLGDPYLKFTWSTNTVTYVPVKELVKTYEGSDYITLDGSTVSLNVEGLKSHLNTVYAAKSVETTVASHATEVAKLSDVEGKVGATIDSKIAAHKTEADAAYKAIDATLEDWSNGKLDSETKALQAKALKVKFGAMAQYVDDTFGIEKVTELPALKSANKIYLLDKNSDGKCIANIWLGDKWYVIGSTIYYTKEEIDTALGLKADKKYVDDTFLRQDASLTTSEITGIINPKK